MELFVLFGQRKENYAGQYGVEALACATESDIYNNPDWINEEKIRHDKTGEFERTEIIKLKVDGKQLLEILRPSSKAIPAVIIGQDNG